jgi:hypothetical protein
MVIGMCGLQPQTVFQDADGIKEQLIASLSDEIGVELNSALKNWGHRINENQRDNLNASQNEN